jgi:phosphate transport system substrate-binding protein
MSSLKMRLWITDIMQPLKTGAIVQAVGQTKGAGYIGLAYETKEGNWLYLMTRKTLLIHSASAKDKSYISRPLFYMFNKVNAAKVKLLLTMHFLGKKIVSEVGYIPLN